MVRRHITPLILDGHTSDIVDFVENESLEATFIVVDPTQNGGGVGPVEAISDPDFQGLDDLYP